MTRLAFWAIAATAVTACGGSYAGYGSGPAAPPPAAPSAKPAAPPMGVTERQAERTTTPPIEAPGADARAARELAAVKRLEDALDAHDTAGWAACYAEDASVTMIPAAGSVRGRTAIRADEDGYIQAFPDLRVVARRVWQTGDVAIVEWVQKATQSGDYMGMKATNRPMGQVVLSVLTFDDAGLVKDERVYLDGASVMAQVAGRGPQREPPPMPTSTTVFLAKGTPDEKANEAWAGRFFGAIDRKDFAGATSMLAPDFEREVTLAPVVEKGQAPAKTSFERMASVFPDLRHVVAHVWGVGDQAIVEYSLQGTQNGALGGIAPTHRRIDWHWVDVFQIADGKATHDYGYVNSIELMAELAPPPAQGTPSSGQPPARPSSAPR